ncbi:Bsd2p [Sporobolomyces salmoneus]|uniref:Bsd2p n=1 Tax=Sporobolomyces salmoneus TaxID=183962 RepID=UPI00317B7824
MSGFLGLGTHTTRPRTADLDFSSFGMEEEEEDDEPSTRQPASTSTHDSPRVPGGYDFEPQAYEGGRAGSESRVGGFSASRSQSQPRLSGLSRPSYGQEDDDDDEEEEAARTRSAPRSWRDLLSQRLRGGGGGALSASHEGGGGTGAESNRLLFSQDESDETDSEERRRAAGEASYPPRNIHLPLPARPPTFAPPPPREYSSNEAASSSTSAPATGRVYGGGSSNDGVFSNLAAKPDGSANVDVVGEGPDKDEVLPAYEAAALDSTPPYWETTVITPGGFLGPDDICVDGMPVGNLFSFAWNLLVSMSFQFVGFLLTYLLHTTHAAKNGSRAGLGITLIQLGFYLKQHTDHGDPIFEDSPSRDETGLNGNAGPRIDNVRWSWWGGEPEDFDSSASSTSSANLPTQLSNTLTGVLEASEGRTNSTGLPSLMGNGSTEAELNSMSMATNEWMSFALVTVGSFLLIGGCLSYWRAVRYARAMRQGQGPGADSENMVAVS